MNGIYVVALIVLFLFFRFLPREKECESWIEQRMYNALTREGFKVRKQVRCGAYRIDLVLPQYRIAIECDGKQWHSSKKQKRHDRKKDAYLRRHGYSVMRFTGSDINSSVGKCVSRVTNKIDRRLNG